MDQKTLHQIDPALDLMSSFSRVSLNTTQMIQRMRQEVIFTDGVIPARLKALTAALWGVSARCEPCLKFYILKAKELGAQEKEVGEFLAIASTMGGCVGEMWALKAYRAWRENPESKAGSEEDHTCCS